MPASPKVCKIDSNGGICTIILACKLMAGRPDKDLADIKALCRTLGIQKQAQAQQVVNQYFPSPIHQATHLLHRTLDEIFGK